MSSAAKVITRDWLDWPFFEQRHRTIGDALDRRVQIVCMTVEGRKAFRRMAKSHGSWLASLLADVPQERLNGLIEELDELKGAVRYALQKT